MTHVSGIFKDTNDWYNGGMDATKYILNNNRACVDHNSNINNQPNKCLYNLR